MIIAIDGPSGAGKSTVARQLSEELGFNYIDTGSMYRALAYKAYKNKIDIKEDQVAEMLKTTDISYCDNEIYLDGERVGKEIREETISIASSKISALKVVRENMVQLQRKIAADKNAILDGRDIGTNVFPKAEFKFFITASVEERARRRYEELKLKGKRVKYESVLEDIISRDKNDSTREFSPLKMADDAILVDTSHMDIESVVKTIVEYIGGQDVL